MSLDLRFLDIKGEKIIGKDIIDNKFCFGVSGNKYTFVFSVDETPYNNFLNCTVYHEMKILEIDNKKTTRFELGLLNDEEFKSKVFEIVNKIES